MSVEQYLASIRAKYTVDDVLACLEKARALKVLVIGDAIKDDYHYVNTLGKSGKEPILAAQFVRSEQFIGGTEAVAKHALACADAVTCVTGPVVTKRRFIESYPFQKLFEIYEMDEAEAARAGDCVAAVTDFAAYDLVIVADYGHGFLTPTLITAIQRDAKKLAVNTQANGGNHGYHTISKYARADLVSLSERELRLDARDQTTAIETLIEREVSRRNTVLITRGAHGCMAAAQDFAEAPAFATHTVDRVGAGDAVFAVAACCYAVGMPLDLLTFLASVVGTQAVAIVGNSRYIERDSLRAAVARYVG